MSDLKIFTDNIEPTALNQIYTLVKQPAFADCKVRIMPDVHAGAGCVIGFTADLGDKVIPNIVGVDIGCGMLTVELGKIDIDFDYLDKAIRENVPSGREVTTIPLMKSENATLQATSRSDFQQATLTRTRATKRLSPTLRFSDYQPSDYRLSTIDYETALGFPGAFSMQKFTEIFRKSAGHGTHLFTSLVH